MLSDTTKNKINLLPAILSIQEVADFFSVHYMTIFRMIQKKKIDAYKDDDGQWCILRQDIKKFCSRQSNL
ncbi:excisionase family DNA-binding protein [Brucepastera parasyntrophica]|nr:excisionase family DNA-binding protein [Brucepastera parasyntrophica]